MCWLYDYVDLTPNFAADIGGTSGQSTWMAVDEKEASYWREGWAKHLPVVMDGVLAGKGD